MNYQNYSSIFTTPVEKIGVRIVDDTLTSITWLPDNVPILDSNSSFSNKIQSLILQYLEDGRPLPDIPMTLTGTNFQLKVWNALRNIKMGQVTTYGDLASKLQTNSRAVGQACRTNPVVIFVPCHRVVSASGIGGYMGKKNRINIKSWLLEHEKVNVR